MKFMKLGSKQNIFQTQGNITSVASELSSDITFNVNGHKFELHKFPFLSKCGCVSKLLAEAHNTNSDDEEVVILDFPGGAESFEMCAKFCYGITFTLSAHNVVEVLCGAKYLEMTEDIEKGNLIFKLEVFLNSSILRGWKDSIICLQSCNAHMPRAEDLKVVGRCIDSISSKTMVEPSKVDWSFTYTRSSSTAMSEHSSSNMSSSHWMSPVPRDWWVEDICGLDVELYWRLMVAVKAKGMPQEQIGESLRVYTIRWLPGVSKEQQLLLDGGVRMGNGGGGGFSTDHAETATKHRELLETIVSLLPSEKGSSSCSFLLKLLKAATILSASPTAKMELVRRIGLQLEDASLRDLLIPSLSYSSDSLYDVDLVQHIVEQYLASEKSPTTSPSNNGGAWRSQSMDRHRSQSIENFNFSERSSFTGHSSQLKVAKLIDSYLAEIARDTNLPLSKFVQLAESVPDCARPVHDKLYHAIDMYLQEHPGLSKSERKRICGLMDCKKLSMEACMHAATNDRLPLRIVVQVLFFEQVRTAMRGGLLQDNLPSNIRALLPPDSSGEISLPELMKGTMVTSSMAVPEEGWDAVHQDYASLKGDLATMRSHIAEAENERNMMQHELAKQQQQKAKSSFLTSFKPRKIFNKIFSSKGFSSSQSSNHSESPVQTSGKELTRQHRNSVG
ncbi:unnamed protein product [Sphagnum jensenii]|uniref:NPH3 domain-containing protein n=1 Tax=Sphagnum jensenii TaxID=128206 RepID=A0ABP0WBC1_9BRYO